MEDSRIACVFVPVVIKSIKDAEVIKCIREFFEEYGTEPLWAEFQNGDDEVKDGISMMVWELATK